MFSPNPEAKQRVHGSRHRLELAPYAVELDAADGGRIVELSLDGRNALATQADSPLAYGVSFWPSPQSDWNWPPPPELDRLPWTSRSEAHAISLESGVNAALGLAASVRVAFERGNAGVRIDYTLENRGAASRRVAPWQNVRMRPGGLTFYAARSGALPPSTLEPELRGGVAWLRHDPETMLENRKSFADGAEGFLAHVENGLLFVASWDDVPRELQAPGEAEIELYVDKTTRFVEIEAQGPYEAIAPGGSLVWTVRHSLERLAAGVTVEVGSESLVEAARALARRARGAARG
ncbi:MAG TPA: hypothetical protein VFZ53_33580 [Polyangiaceae bacterium]